MTEYYSAYPLNDKHYDSSTGKYWECIFFHYDGKYYAIAVNEEYGKNVVFSNAYSSGIRWITIKNKKLLQIDDRTISNIAKSWSTLTSFSKKHQYKKTVIKAYEDFKKIAPALYQESKSNILCLSKTGNNIEHELVKTSKLLARTYAVNIIPAPFRNLYAVYYFT
ncbi:MAG: hypothetical protein ACLRVT_00845 [Oscillospiraceae bacterium]